jgi:hypothetical protein
MENFKEEALKRSTHKPVCWFRYVDNTFVTWPHGLEKLDDFLLHLNSIHTKSNSPRRRRQMATFPSWILLFAGD